MKREASDSRFSPGAGSRTSPRPLGSRPSYVARSAGLSARSVKVESAGVAKSGVNSKSRAPSTASPKLTESGYVKMFFAPAGGGVRPSKSEGSIPKIPSGWLTAQWPAVKQRLK